jgi:segregation and condensation protein B
MLFASGEAVPLQMLGMALNLGVDDVRLLLQNMADTYASEKRGFQLIQIEDAFQLCTNPIYYDDIRRLVQAPRRKTLTPALLETLAIIAYKKPCTKSQIEEIRGVNADHAVNRLMEYGLIAEAGRLDAPGKPILFSPSEEFYRYFGLSGSGDLPEPAVPTEPDAPPEQLEL